MNLSNIQVTDLLGFLADTQRLFRDSVLVFQRRYDFEKISTEISPCRGEPREYAEHGVTLAFFLNANLREPTTPQQRMLGTSLLLRITNGKWLLEAEVGWSGRDIGWDQFDERNEVANSFEDAVKLVPSLVAWLESRFIEEADKIGVRRDSSEQ